MEGRRRRLGGARGDGRRTRGGAGGRLRLGRCPATRARVARSSRAISYAALLSSGAIAVQGDRSSDLVRVLQAGSARARGLAALDRAGVPGPRRAPILAPCPLTVDALDDRPRSRGDEAVAFAGALVLYLALLTYGIAVGYGVVEEKSSRVIEIVVSTVRSGDLLAGKGCSSSSWWEASAWRSGWGPVRSRCRAGPPGRSCSWWWSSCSATRSTPRSSPPAPRWSRARRISSRSPRRSPSCSWGRTSPRAPRSDSSSGLAKVLGILPFTSPIVLPGRVALHVASVGEVVLSLALSLAAIPLAIALAGRLYRGAVLFTGACVPFRVAWRGG